MQLDAEMGPGQALANANLQIFTHRNDQSFQSRSVVTLRDGGPGVITDYRVVAQRAEYDRARQALHMGISTDAGRLIRHGGRMLIWSNLSDQQLTPYMTANYYRALASANGGYDRLQRNVRLFSIPGSAHCSMDGVGPDNFDALGAMEAWVERDTPPNALPASLYPSSQGQFGRASDFSAPPVRTMPLCMYPQMARYNGSGDMNDSSNWSCPSRDTGMLTMGESGRRAGLSP